MAAVDAEFGQGFCPTVQTFKSHIDGWLAVHVKRTEEGTEERESEENDKPDVSEF